MDRHRHIRSGSDLGPRLVRARVRKDHQRPTSWSVKRREVIEVSGIWPGGGGGVAFPYKEDVGGVRVPQRPPKRLVSVELFGSGLEGR